MRSLHTKAHTFVSRFPLFAGQKSVRFSNPKKNSFFSFFLVFYFFATHNRNKSSWAETAKTFTDSNLTITEDRWSAYNSVLPQLAVTCKIEA